VIIKGRDKPVVYVSMDSTGVLTVRVDFELYPAGWVEITLLNEDLEHLERGDGPVTSGEPQNIGRAN
jgi:hypothetical protein